MGTKDEVISKFPDAKCAKDETGNYVVTAGGKKFRRAFRSSNAWANANQGIDDQWTGVDTQMDRVRAFREKYL